MTVFLNVCVCNVACNIHATVATMAVRMFARDPRSAGMMLMLEVKPSCYPGSFRACWNAFSRQGLPRQAREPADQ